MSRLLAGIAVFVCAGSVLVLEILAGRMMAPYVGVSITTYTGAIGAVLAGIAAGAAFGGQLADRRRDPARALGPLVALGAAAAFLAVPATRVLGERTDSLHVVVRTLVLSGLVFMPPAAVLSTVTPIVAKILLRDTASAGSVVGWLSALGTTGALAGTFLTGFVFIAAWPVPAIAIAVGAVLVALAIALMVSTRPAVPAAAVVAAVVLVAGGAAVAIDDRCDSHTVYYCAQVIGRSDDIRLLQLDDLIHAAVDVSDPTAVLLPYVQTMSTVVDAVSDGPLDAVVIGAGGLAIPRWLAATRPGSTQTVLEIDDALVGLVERELGGPLDDVGVDVRIGDARVTIRDLPTDSADLVVGDAFASLSVPWHLTTKEFAAELDRVLRPGGLYVMNLIERSPARFVWAQVATLEATFGTIGVAIPEERSLDSLFGNVVIVAGDTVDVAAVRGRLRDIAVAFHTDTLEAHVDGAPVLTDSYAPVDQWLRGF